MPEAYKPIDISNDPELLKLAEEVHSSQHRAFCAAMMKIWHCWCQSSQAPAQGEERKIWKLSAPQLVAGKIWSIRTS